MFYYRSMNFFTCNDFIETDKAYNEAIAFLNSSDFYINNARNVNKFVEEIFPIIQLSKIERANEVYFCGSNNELHCDAQIKKNNAEIIHIECTTSMRQYFYSKIQQHVKIYKGACFGPHSKVRNVNDKNISYGDIIIDKKGKLYPQLPSTSNTSCSGFIDVDKYIIEDIEKINEKILKGKKKGYYKNYTLILTCDHSINLGLIFEYGNRLNDFWINTKENPFVELFVVNYDSILFDEIFPNTTNIINKSRYPIPIFLSKNKNLLKEVKCIFH